MKNTILSFALPLLLLAATPAVADDARLLWVSVDGAATVEDGDTNPPVAQYQSANTGHSINAFRVSVPDASASGGTNHLVFAYEDNGSMVVGGSEPVVRSLDFADGGALWAPLDLAAYADPDLVVTMELGYVDPASPSSFEKLAFATERLRNLLAAPHVSIQSDLNPPALLPWSPDPFTVTVPWAIAYDLAGGTNNAANPEFYTEGQLPIALLPAGREGYTFAGWTNELGAVVEEIAAGSTGDRSFGATWLENVEPPALESKVYTGALQTADVPSNAGYTVVANVGGTDVDTYNVVLALASGYVWSDGTDANKTVAWSITPATMTVLSEDWTGVYDAEGHSPSATASVVEGTTFEYSLDGTAWSATAPAFTNVVATNVHIRATNPNFTTATTNVALTVTNRIVTLTGASGSETYTGSAQTLDTFETDGLVQDHVLSGVTYAATGTAVGTYPGAFSGTPAVTAPGDVDVTANYAFAYVTGALTITPGTMTLQVSDWIGVYDGEAHSNAVQVVPAEGTTIRYSVDYGAEGTNWTLVAPALTGVGTLDVLVQATNANYVAVSTNVALQVTNAWVTATATDVTVAYGTTAPSYGVTYAGWAQGESASVLTTQPTVGYAAYDPATTYPGTYEIAISGAVAPNYVFAYVPGTLTVTAVDYAITYDLAGGALAEGASNPSTYTVTNSFTLANPTKEGHTFAGWTGTDLVAATTTVAVPLHSTGDRSYTATWTADKHLLTITYVTPEGVAAPETFTSNVVYGTSYSVGSPAVTGHTPDVATVEGEMGTEDVSVTVTYTADKHLLTITYVTPDGVAAPETFTSNVVYGTSYSVGSPAVTGHTPDVATVEGEMGTEDVSVTVTYTADKHLLTIVYVTPDGVAAPETFTSNVVYGTSYSVESPAVTGHTPDVATVSGEMGTEDVSVTVTYTADMYDVIWLADGLEFASNHLAYGAAIVAPSPDPTKEATAACTYTFAGWVPQPEETVTSNATYTASFTETTNKYTVAFEWHGGSSSADYDYGTLAADVAVPRDPPSYVENDTIHTFTNWNPAVVADVTGAATYTAQYADAAAVATVITVADATTGATTTNYYATLAEAIGAAPTNSTVRLLADVEEPAEALNTPITLDLNGKEWTVAGTGEPPVTNAVAISAAVAVVDNSENGGGAIDSAAEPAVTVAQGGALTVGEKARITEPTGFPGTTVEVAAGGALVVDGAVDGDVEAGAGSAVSIAGAVWGDVSAAGEGAAVAVNGGTVGGDVTVAGGADVSVTGEYASVGGGIAATGAGSEIAVSGGATVTEDVVANGGASATVDGGTVIGALAAQNGGSVEVASGSVSGGVSATGAGSTAEVSGGEVSSALGAGVTVAAGATGTVSGDASVSGGVLATGAGSSVEVEDGTVLGGVVAADSAEAEVSGGTVGSVLADGGRVVVSGGSVSGDASAANGGALEIGDGSVAQTVQVDAASTAEITGGTVGDGIVAFGADSVHVEGGTVAGTIVAPTDAVVVTGGTFTEDPSVYVARGYYAARVGEVFEVLPQNSIFETTIVVGDAGVYDGTGKEPTVTVTTNGVAIAAEDGYTLSYSSNTNAGLNTASVKVSGTGAWMGETNLNFTIAKAPIVITVDDATKVCGENDPVFTGTVEGLLADGDLGEVTYMRTNATEAAGVYTGVLVARYTENANYDVTVVPGDFTITAVYVAQVGTEKFFTIAAAIEAAGGLVADPEVITLLTNADASVTLETPAQRLRVALDGHELTVLSGDPIRYEVATNVEDSVTVYALEQLKADGLMIVRFDYEAAKLAYDMGTAENMLNMYPTNEPIWCTVATATDLRATDWTAVEDSRLWRENLVPLESATDGDLEWLENLDTTSSLVRFWRIAVTPFKLDEGETVEFRASAPADPDGD